jgi:hypothetical protein
MDFLGDHQNSLSDFFYYFIALKKECQFDRFLKSPSVPRFAELRALSRLWRETFLRRNLSGDFLRDHQIFPPQRFPPRQNINLRRIKAHGSLAADLLRENFILKKPFVSRCYSGANRDRLTGILFARNET